MPITYQIDVDKRTIRTRAVGHVTMQDVIDHFRALEQDPQCPERPDVLLDLSEVDSLPETHELSIVVRELKRICAKIRFDACAILASRDALFGMMRMFEALAEECFRVTRTFRIASEAEAWLVSQQSERKPADGN
ncbi:MAG: hypothetical protein LAO23_08420 [Acidobacteriia bacterium]|nr:hypothetical protein [Terriglobia bacterium]